APALPQRKLRHGECLPFSASADRVKPYIGSILRSLNRLERGSRCKPDLRKPRMSLSRKQVLELAKILHSTTKALGQSSKLSAHQEKLSHLLGYRHWNAASTCLPEVISE